MKHYILLLALAITPCFAMRKRKIETPTVKHDPVTFMQCKSIFKGKSSKEFERLDAECFMSGFSHFFAGSSDDIAQSMPKKTKAGRKIEHIGITFPFYKINQQVPLHLFFTEKNQHEALLFLKYVLELNLRNFVTKTQNPETISIYLYGVLTGSAEDEIEKAYQLENFIFRHADFLSTQVKDVWADLSLHQQNKWPVAVKKMFDLYKTNVWSKVKSEIYEPQRKYAQDWLNHNKEFSVQELKKQIDDLLKQLSQHSL